MVNSGSVAIFFDGSELFYRRGDQVFAVEIHYEPELRAGDPTFLFEGPYDYDPDGHQHYDISLDGERFLMVRRGAEGSFPDRLHVVDNVIGLE